LDEVRALRRKEGRALGKIVSELLVEALARRKQPVEPTRLEWISRPMRALVDLADKEALRAALNRDDP
jgi:hypothetical protein